MGEKENGGMLRVIVVISLVTILSIFGIGTVLAMKNSMQTNRMYATNGIEKAVADANKANTASADTTVNAEDSYLAFGNWDTSAKTAYVVGFKSGKHVDDVVIPEKIVKDNVTYTVIGVSGLAFNYEGINSVKLPSTLQNISGRAFSYNNLTSISIPEGVTNVDEEAFAHNKITSVTFPSTLKTLGNGALSYNSLTSVTIPKTINMIDYNTFKYNQLTSVTVPGNIKSIGRNAFSNNVLKTVTIENGTQVISQDAFSINKITSVSIPDSITSIEYSAFEQNKLTEVSVPGSASVNDSAFDDGTSTIDGINYPKVTVNRR